MKETPHHHGHRWTTEELKKLMEMWEAGVPVAEIAAAVGTGARGVSKMVVRLRRDGIPLTRRTKGHVAGRRNKPWTQEEVEYLFRRRLEGDTSDQIASALERTANAVDAMILKLRMEGVPIAMRGNGVRRLWSAEALKGAAAGRFDDAEIRLAENLPN